MDVILDTNIYRADVGLRSGRFDILLDYVHRTGAHILMPRLVKDELGAIIRRELSAKASELQRTRQDAQRLIPHRDIDPLEELFDAEEEARSYLTYVLRRAESSEQRLLGYKGEYLEEVVTRAIERRRPCSDKGEEIRDAVLWLTVLDAAEEARERSIVFVSQNTRQFADRESNLHPDLEQECKERNVRVHYYASLEAFAKERATTVEFATLDWLKGAIDEDAVFEQAVASIQSIAERTFERLKEDDEVATGDTTLIDASLLEPEFFTYEMTDGSFRIEATYEGTAEVEFGLFRYIEPNPVRYLWSDGERILPRFGWQSDTDRERDYSGRVIDIAFRILVEALVRDSHVVEWSVVDVETD